MKSTALKGRCDLEIITESDDSPCCPQDRGQAGVAIAKAIEVQPLKPERLLVTSVKTYPTEFLKFHRTSYPGIPGHLWA